MSLLATHTTTKINAKLHSEQRKTKTTNPISQNFALLVTLSSLRKLFQLVKISLLCSFMTSGQKMENMILQNVLPTKYFLPLSLCHLHQHTPPPPQHTHTKYEYKKFYSKSSLKKQHVWIITGPLRQFPNDELLLQDSAGNRRMGVGLR